MCRWGLSACPVVFPSLVLEIILKSHLPADLVPDFSIIKFGIFLFYRNIINTIVLEVFLSYCSAMNVF